MRTTGLYVLAVLVSAAAVFGQQEPNSKSARDPDVVAPVDAVPNDESKSRSVFSNQKTDAVQVRVSNAGLLLMSGEVESVKRLEKILKLLQEGRLEEAKDAQRLAQQAVAQATTQAKNGSRAELERLVREDFTFRQKTQMAEIKLLKQRLESLERRVEQQDKVREDLIRQRVESLLSTPSEQTDPFESMIGRPSGKPGAPKPPVSLDRTGSHTVRAGDTLGVFIPNVLGKPDESPPIHKDPTGQRPPALGYPIAVRENGSISLPFIGEMGVAGRSLAEIERMLRRSYESKAVLRPNATILVSLIGKVDDRPNITLRTATGVNSSATLEKMRTASEYVEQFSGLQREIDAHEEKIPGDSNRKAHLQRLDDFKSQYAALRHELEYQLSVIRSSMNAAKVEVNVADERLTQAKRLHANGVMAKSQLDAAHLSLVKAETAVEQLELLYDLYQQVVPKTSAESAAESKKRLRLELPQRVVEIRLKQRTEKVIPGSDSQLSLHMGDVTAGQAFVSVRTADQDLLLDEASLEEGQIASFKVNGDRFYVRMKDLRNVLIGEDFGTIQIVADRADFRSVP